MIRSFGVPYGHALVLSKLLEENVGSSSSRCDGVDSVDGDKS